ncbi:peptidoglycan D,D-transpeptidase FtsI family protein [Sporosarcina sp. CAU 1771]
MKQPIRKRKVDEAKVRQRKILTFRMNFLFFSIFILFSLLIFRLGYLQIVKGEEYVLRLEKTEEIPINTSVPRGRIFDRDGRILVDNEPKNAITYTKTSRTSSSEILEVAEKLADLIEQDTNRVTLGDKRDFWILKNREAAAMKVPKEEVGEIEGSTSEVQREVNRRTRQRITDAEINSFSERDLEVLAIYREMMSGYAYSPQIVKSGNVSDVEYATVSEQLGDLPGVNTTTDWDRVRKSTATVLGTTTNTREGLPRTDLDYFLWRDYSMNDRVGRSFLEKTYEDLLKGQKAIAKNIKDRSGKVIETKTVNAGIPGKDLILTFDSELQHNLELALTDQLLQAKAEPNSQMLDRAFLVMMNPKNGEVLALVGKQIVTDRETGKREVRDYAFGTFTDSYVPGSTVKMATLLTGYQEGAARLGERKIDEMLLFSNGLKKSSIFNRSFNQISISDIEAIGRSSNVYMFKTALAIGNGTYRRGGNLSLDRAYAFETMRNSYESFGLGSKTGIDLPGEAVRIPGMPDNPGLILDYSIGQYATYTTLQLAQYVSTIANDGYRIAPKVLKEIREPSEDGKHFGPLVQESESKVLNRINNTEQEITQVKRGMYHTYYGAKGSAFGYLKGKSYDAAGKTGTAQDEVYVDGKKYNTINLSHVGYAPYDNPEVAFAVIIPHISTNQSKYKPFHNQLAVAALDAYFELKEARSGQLNDFNTLNEIQPPLEREE